MDDKQREIEDIKNRYNVNDADAHLLWSIRHWEEIVKVGMKDEPEGTRSSVRKGILP